MAKPDIAGQVTLICGCGHEITAHLHRLYDDIRATYVVMAEDQKKVCPGCGKDYEFGYKGIVAFRVGANKITGDLP